MLSCLHGGTCLMHLYTGDDHGHDRATHRHGTLLALTGLGAVAQQAQLLTQHAQLPAQGSGPGGMVVMAQAR